MLLGCEVLFGREEGAATIELIERLTGRPCPCKEGHGCPLLAPAPDPEPIGYVMYPAGAA